MKSSLMYGVFLHFVVFQLELLSSLAHQHDDRTRNTVLGKKLLFYHHTEKFEDTLCWTVKIWDSSALFIEPESTIVTLSRRVGLTSLGKISDFDGHYTLCLHDSSQVPSSDVSLKTFHGFHGNIKRKSSADFTSLHDSIEHRLEHDHLIEWYSQDIVRTRQKRSVRFHDPAFPRQWHLYNNQNHIMDINVTGVWDRNITGEGVTVAVVDDGVEWNNPDLQGNYNYQGSWDLNDNDPDPMPSDAKESNHHGTRCAGEIAAVANNVCGVGVAYKARISGLRVLDGPMTDSLEAQAFNKKLQINDVYSCSWGPDDDGKTVDGPHIMAAKAMKYGVDFGRKGYGSIFVVASGNGGRHQDNCNYDGYANSIYTITIGAVDEDGQMPYYAEECASMLGVTFSSGKHNERDIVTTDWTRKGGQGCTDRHSGTSAAAPLAAGMIALMLQARPCLTSRDVQYLMIMTAVKVDVDLAHWQKNGAGLYHSHKHGFGLLKAWRLVNAAKVWEMVPWITSFSYGQSETLEIPKRSRPLTVLHKVKIEDIEGYNLNVLEHVQVTVTITHPFRGKLGIKLNCPSGTESIIGAPRPADNSTKGFTDWTFTTVRCWGERPTGKWLLTITDSDSGKYGPGYLKKWQLILFGTLMTPEEFQNRRELVEDAMSGKYLNDSFSLPCPPPPVVAQPYIPLSPKILKILMLAGAFCLLMAVYETLEYAFCYNDEKKEHRAKLKLEERAQRLASENSENVNPDDATESTGLLHSEDIPMETFSFRAAEIHIGADACEIDTGQIPQELLKSLSPEEVELNLNYNKQNFMAEVIKSKDSFLDVPLGEDRSPSTNTSPYLDSNGAFLRPWNGPTDNADEDFKPDHLLLR